MSLEFVFLFIQIFYTTARASTNPHNHSGIPNIAARQEINENSVDIILCCSGMNVCCVRKIWKNVKNENQSIQLENEMGENVLGVTLISKFDDATYITRAET